MSSQSRLLDAHRTTIDEIDEALVSLLSRRLAVCLEIADLKSEHGIDLMDHARVDAVRQHVSSLAVAHELDPGFVAELYSRIVDEACRLEQARMTPDSSTDPTTVFARAAIALDHVAIAVRDLEAAIEYFCGRVGLELVERRTTNGERSGMISAVLRARNIRIVLVQGTSPESNVCRYIETYGPGVQHLALSVTELGPVVDDLKARGCEMLTGIITGPGLQQAFSMREPNSGMQLELLARHDNDGFLEQNVEELFRAMERAEAI